LINERVNTEAVDQYAVVGNPISHSKSPLIHEMFAAQTQQAMQYGKIESPLAEFEGRVGAFFAKEQGKGLNITVPFKERAWALCQSRSDRAELAGAVNTLFTDKEGRICGDNTDGIGLVSDLKSHGVVIKGKKVLIVGAGGAVRGVLQPILKELPELVFICNRTKSKAVSLAALFGGLGHVEGGGFDDAKGEFDLVINGTSASLAGDLPPISESLISSETVSYDMMYGSEATVFNRWAQSAGASITIDGLGMLAGQAAEAFYLWRGVRPETGQVIAALRA
jgi:shikimate dehydrogenase